jgi:energy-coupling factor transport system permease protein
MSYKEGNSWFHRIDPINKFVWIILVSLWLLSQQQLVPALMISGGIFLISIFGAGVNLAKAVRRMLLLVIGGIWLVIFQGLFRPGPGVDIGVFHLSYEGMQLGITLYVRTVGLLASSFAFSRTTNPKDLTTALIQMKVPYPLAYMPYMSLRFIPLLEADFRTINDAQKLRGVKSGWNQAMRTIISMTEAQLRRAEEIAIALETRAFGLHNRQTLMKEVPLTFSGIFLNVVTVGFMGVHLAGYLLSM